MENSEHWKWLQAQAYQQYQRQVTYSNISSGQLAGPPIAVGPVVPASFRQAAEPDTSKSNEEKTSIQTTKKSGSRARWGPQHVAVLLESWKENQDVIKSHNALTGWKNVKASVDAAGPSKTVEQVKGKIKTLIDAYKKAVDINRNQTGAERATCPFYDEIDEVMSLSHTCKLPETKEFGAGTLSEQTPHNSSAETSVENSLVLDDCFSPRSFFDPEVEMQEDPHLMDINNANETELHENEKTVELNNSFVDELHDERSSKRKRKADDANKNEKVGKGKKTNLETVVNLFKESEESQQKFFREMIENQRKSDAEEKARDQAFFLELAKIMKDN
ncbi:uncharacterized protein [Clytia hemisphaerica]|uniref:uncharacterized protein n=1 Tax=Clytia hemisphaerica TaxID=252671 RepID=UPI0034D592DC